jgi:low temperature requirement protein LtrA
MSTPVTEPVTRVSTLELFFDLVFVFTFTQLSHLLVEDLTWAGLGQVLLLFGVLWWMYGGYAWLTNAMAPTTTARRLLILVGMGGFLVVALAIPAAFEDGGIILGLGYLLVVVVHAGLFTITRGGRGMRVLGPLNLLSAGLVLAAGFADGPLVYALWGAAMAVQAASGFVTDTGALVDISASHFVERHGLLVLVALGESIVAIGIGAGELEPDLTLAASGTLALALSAGLWWTYFSGDDDKAEHVLAATPTAARARLALLAYFFAHIPILLGVVVTAAGIEYAIAHVSDHVDLAHASALAGGVALYLGGDALFRRILRIGTPRLRALAALLALATIPIGLGSVALAQLAALVALVVATLVAEARTSS